MYLETQKNQKQLPRSLEWFLLIYNFKLFLLFLLKEKFRRQSLVWGGGLSEIMQEKLQYTLGKMVARQQIEDNEIDFQQRMKTLRVSYFRRKEIKEIKEHQTYGENFVATKIRKSEFDLDFYYQDVHYNRGDYKKALLRVVVFYLILRKLLMVTLLIF